MQKFPIYCKGFAKPIFFPYVVILQKFVQNSWTIQPYPTPFNENQVTAWLQDSAKIESQLLNPLFLSIPS